MQGETQANQDVGLYSELLYMAHSDIISLYQDIVIYVVVITWTLDLEKNMQTAV